MYFSYEECRLVLNEMDCASMLKSPLVINWNINGRCQNNCIYCFSNDYTSMPDLLSESELNNIINNLKSLKPLVVVISGGEPLLYPKLKYVLNELTNFCSVILDTNGLCLDTSFINYCKDNKILIRVSLDDHRSYINDNIRISSIKNSTTIVLSKIQKLLGLNANFIIHSVLSDKNSNRIVEFGELLLNIGIKFWEIQVVVPFKGDRLSLEEDLCQLEKFSLNNENKLKIKIHTNNEDEKGIILINPKGEFLTRKTNSLEKEYIDLNNIYNPPLNILMNALDIHNHFKRYTGNII